MDDVSSSFDYEDAYLSVVTNQDVYQESLIDSASALLKAGADQLGVTRLSMWVMSDDGRGVDCLLLYDARTGEFESGAVLSEDLFPRYFEALHSGRVIDAVDTFTDPRTNELSETYLEVLDVRSLLDATIRSVHDGTLLGVICAEMVGEQRNWTKDEKLFVASISDLASQRMVTSELVASEKTYSALYEATNHGIIVFKDGQFHNLNPAACEMFGGTIEDFIGTNPHEFSPEFQLDGQRSAVVALARVMGCLRGEPQNFEWVCRRLDGTEFYAEITLNSVQIGGEDTLFSSIRDITAKKEAERSAHLAQLELERRAAYDSLTGLRNRDQLLSHVNDLIAMFEGTPGHVALLLLDLNRFKEINDTLGHATGDKVLVAVAKLLSPQIVELGGQLFRLGGDEFVAVFDSETATKPFDQLVDVLKLLLSEPVEVDGASFVMTSSIGAASFPANGSDSLELLRCADVAMYHTKADDTVSSWYVEENDVHSRRRLAMVDDLRTAISEDQLVLHYQPRIDIHTGGVTGCEALVRWQHPELGLLAPNEFLPIAEMSDLIHPLTDWVVGAAFDQIERLRSLGISVPVAVNLSARNLPDKQLFDAIEARLQEPGMCAQCLEIEITESALICNPQRSTENLLRLEAHGVSIAIDDFGTGYSSLSMLKELPLDTLKIDRSFVDGLLAGGADRVIVDSTITLAHNFSATVVAEGVENQETLDALKDLNCDQAQGYFIARPMPSADLEQWLTVRMGEHSKAAQYSKAAKNSEAAQHSEAA